MDAGPLAASGDRVRTQDGLRMTRGLTADCIEGEPKVSGVLVGMRLPVSPKANARQRHDDGGVADDGRGARNCWRAERPENETEARDGLTVDAIVHRGDGSRAAAW